jgi:SNF2 family DNA or RNA helicase
MPTELDSPGQQPELAWSPIAQPPVFDVDVTLKVLPFVTGWNRAIRRPVEVEVRDLRCASAAPEVVSLVIKPEPVTTRSFTFADPDGASSATAWNPPPAPAPAVGQAPTAPAIPQGPAGGVRLTRIKPPSDVIKLEDRLNYILQPSLELLLTERSLHFPFQPFPYQLEGVAFLYPRHAAILADEMGLGKTMQAITSIRLLLRTGEVRSVLMVCPKPLVTNWQREFAQWAPEIPLLVIEGDQAKRHWQWQLQGVPVKVANYELLRRDFEGFGPGETPPQFDLVVLDESQRIKNRGSTTSQTVCSIPRNRSWALTGTPVENSAEDLIGIFEFLAPGFLSSDMKPRRLGQAVSDYIIRRTKDQVLKDMPPKMFRDADLELSPEQRAAYQMAENDGVVRLTAMGEEVTIQHVFELVLRLKQICNFDPATGDSSKLERLEADLEEVAASGRKAIVFSQWVETLQKLAQRLGRFGPLEYHGRVPSIHRDKIIRRFREDPDCHVILMSYGAGGVGLNLQFASYVFLFDRWWNPAVEDQAINRAHRIGAAGPVTVTRFITVGTIEERINRVLEEKRELFNTIFSDTEGHRKLGLNQRELFGLFDLKCPSGTIKLAA